MVQPTATAKAMRRVVRALPEASIFMECDIQEKMRKHIFRFDTVEHNAKRLAQLAGLLNVPLISTQ